jgi:hypothetical protein
MRGDVVFRVYGQHDGRDRDREPCFGAYRTQEEARAAIVKLEAREFQGRNWAAEFHNKGFVVRPFTVEVDFDVPALPKPRDRYAVKVAKRSNAPGTWDSSVVEVFRRSGNTSELERVCEYVRNYAMLHTFEPFRQGDRDYALISRQYTRAAVLDLATGAVIAEEEEKNPGSGFCPVGFYVPDWWDVHDGSTIPGSEHWNEDHEWPAGESGFVWGCYWGDDSSWKVQHLDLRRIREGVITREERFGYVALATHSWDPPWKDLTRSIETRSPSPAFIRVSRYRGVSSVGFDVELAFDLTTGAARTSDDD